MSAGYLCLQCTVGHARWWLNRPFDDQGNGSKSALAAAAMGEVLVRGSQEAAGSAQQCQGCCFSPFLSVSASLSA